MGFVHSQVGRLKQALPIGLKNRIARARVTLRQPSYMLRPLPGLLIIGTQKGGTSSLYKYLGDHPNARPSLRKEVEYFSKFYDRGEAWYRSNFQIGASGAAPNVHFEASPEYLSDPRAPARARQDVPHAGIVALVRDPVERALSHYKHSVRNGLESETLKRALELEDERTRDDWKRLKDGFEGELPTSIRRFAYAAKGEYAEGLQRWTSEFGDDRVLILNSDEFFADTAHVLNSICTFAGISPSYEARRFEVFKNQTRVAPIPTDHEVWARAFLRERFEEPNRTLADIMNEAPSWAAHADE